MNSSIATTDAAASTVTRAIPRSDSGLTDEMLARFAERAPQVRPRQRVLRGGLRGAAAGRISPPGRAGGARRARLVARGGRREQRRLGYSRRRHGARDQHAPLLDRHRRGSVARRRHVAAMAAGGGRRGEVFAAGHAESGNDIPVLLSTTKAERVEGGYRFTGRKSFGSLSPVWTYLGIHGMDTADPSHPKIVHAFMPRDTEGLPHRGDLGRAGHARDAQRRHDPRRRLRARSLHRPGRAGGRRRHRSLRARGCSPGRSWGSATSTTASPGARSS